MTLIDDIDHRHPYRRRPRRRRCRMHATLAEFRARAAVADEENTYFDEDLAGAAQHRLPGGHGARAEFGGWGLGLADVRPACSARLATLRAGDGARA